MIAKFSIAAISSSVFIFIPLSSFFLSSRAFIASSADNDLSFSINKAIISSSVLFVKSIVSSVFFAFWTATISCATAEAFATPFSLNIFAISSSSASAKFPEAVCCSIYFFVSSPNIPCASFAVRFVFERRFTYFSIPLTSLNFSPISAMVENVSLPSLLISLKPSESVPIAFPIADNPESVSESLLVSSLSPLVSSFALENSAASVSALTPVLSI